MRDDDKREPLTADDLAAMRARCEAARAADAELARAPSNDAAWKVGRAWQTFAEHAREDMPRLLAEVTRLRILEAAKVADVADMLARHREIMAATVAPHAPLHDRLRAIEKAARDVCDHACARPTRDPVAVPDRLISALASALRGTALGVVDQPAPLTKPGLYERTLRVVQAGPPLDTYDDLASHQPGLTLPDRPAPLTEAEARAWVEQAELIDEDGGRSGIVTVDDVVRLLMRAPPGDVPPTVRPREQHAFGPLTDAEIAKPLECVAALVTDDSDRVLLICSAKPGRGWELPGGKVEAGETALAAAEREVREETGVRAVDLRVRLDPLTGTPKPGAEFASVIHVVTGRGGGNAIPGDDAADARWWSRDGVLDLYSGGDLSDLDSQVVLLEWARAKTAATPDEPICLCPATSEYDPPCPAHGVLGIGISGR